jgi:hypothetical protein
MKVPPKEKWLAPWSGQQIEKILAIAARQRQLGALNDESAWKSAESLYWTRFSGGRLPSNVAT